MTIEKEVNIHDILSNTFKLTDESNSSSISTDESAIRRNQNIPLTDGPSVQTDNHIL